MASDNGRDPDWEVIAAAGCISRSRGVGAAAEALFRRERTREMTDAAETGQVTGTQAVQANSTE
jgi:hypothetical protein